VREGASERGREGERRRGREGERERGRWIVNNGSEGKERLNPSLGRLTSRTSLGRLTSRTHLVDLELLAWFRFGVGFSDKQDAPRRP
jgi:hypothetical protein